MMKKLLIIIFCAYANIVVAQNPFNRLKIEHWDTKKGLPNDLVLSIFQSKDGFLWMNSYTGLTRFDGVSFTTFNSRNLPLLKSDNVFEISETDNGTLWIGTQSSGLLAYKQGKFEQYLPNYNNLYQVILQANHQLLIFAQKPMLFDSKSKKVQELDSLIFNKLVQEKKVTIPNQTDKFGNIWRLSRRGVGKSKDGKIHFLTAQEGITNDVFYGKLYVDSQSRVWLSSNKGLWLWNGEKMIQIPELKDKVFSLNSDFPKQILEDSRGGIWVAYPGGVAYLPSNSSQFFFAPNDYFKFTNFSSMLEDKEGNIWLSSDKGIFKLSYSKFTNFLQTDGSFLNGRTSAVCEVEPNKYLTYNANTLLWIENGQVSPYQYKNQDAAKAKEEVFHIFKDSQANIWICSISKIIKINKEGEKTYQSNAIVRFAFEDNQKKMWFAIPRKGIAFLNDKDELEMLNLPQVNLEGCSISTIRKLVDGTWLVASYNQGIVLIDSQGKPTYFNEKNGLNTIGVFNTYEEKNGTIWLVSNSGISRYQNKKFAHITYKDGLPDNGIFDFLPDKQGFIWFPSNRGLIRAKKQELDDYLDKKIEKINWQVYDDGDGMLNRQCVGARHSAITTDGKILVPTFGGLVEIDPNKLIKNPTPPSVVIHQFLWEDKAQDLTQSLRLDPGNRRFIFEYSGLSLVAPEKVQFKFRLMGYDQDWISALGERRAFYTNLPSGTYTFQVIACNNDGVWNEKGASLTFTIQPFFYETWWFRSLLILFLIGLMVSIVRWRTYSIRQKNELLESQVASRTLELKEANEELHSTNDELHKKNEDITASITYAKRIQTAILPRIEDIQKSLLESFILFKPRDIVSGDFYFFVKKEDKTILACADCTGHGVPGAFMSMIGNEILTNIVEIQGITSPDLILNELHKSIRTALKQGESENRDGMDIAIVLIDKEKGVLEYAGAMNPLYYVQNGELHEIKADKFPIGGMQKEQERTFTKHEIPLGIWNDKSEIWNEIQNAENQPQTIATANRNNQQQSTIIYLCSDGFQDQFGGAQGKKFMVKRFRELLFSIHHLPMDEQKQILDDTIEQWMAEGKERQIDDILVVGVAMKL